MSNGLIQITNVHKALKIVAEEYGTTVKDMKGSSRKRHIAYARQMAAYVLKDVCQSHEIGELMNNDQYDVEYFIKRTGEFITLYQDTREHFENILTALEHEV